MMKIIQISFAVGAALLLGACGTKLPTCNQQETLKIVEQVINNLPIAKAVGAKFVSLKSIQELGFNKDSDLRTCSAILVTNKGEDQLSYSVKWQNKEVGKFWVEAQIQADSAASAEAEVALQAKSQYEMAKRNNADPVNLCVQAGFVTAAYLQAGDEQNYAKWMQIERSECAAAGISK